MSFFGSLFKSILRIVAIVLVIVALVYLFVAIAVASSWLSLATAGSLFLPVGMTATSAWTFLAVSAFSFAFAAIIDHDTAVGTLGNAIDGVASAGSAAAQGVGTILSGVTTGLVTAAQPLVSSVGGWVLGGIGVLLAWRYLNKPKDDDTPEQKGVSNVPN